MPDQLQLRGGTTTEHATFTGASKEVTIDTTKKTAVVHDASTAGGNPLMREDGANSALINGSVTEPALAFADDSANTGIYSPGTDQVAVTTNGVERVEWGTSEVVFNDGGEDYDFRVEGDTNANLLFVDASTDRVGIGTSSVSNKLEVYSDTDNSAIAPNSDVSGLAITNASTATGAYTGLLLRSYGGTDSVYLRAIAKANNNIDFEIGGQTSGQTSAIPRLTIDSSGRLLVGLSSTMGRTAGVNGGAIQIEGTDYEDSALQLFSNADSANTCPSIHLGRSRGTALGSSTIVQDDDRLGGLFFVGADGTDRNTPAASVQAYVDGTPGADDMPGRLVFSTTPDGAASPTDRMTIDSTGRMLIGTNSSLTTSANQVIQAVTTGGAQLVLGKNDSAVTTNEELGVVRFYGNDGGTYQECGRIACQADGNHSNDNKPSSLRFWTTQGSAGSPTERMRITSNAYVRLTADANGLQFKGDTAAANALNDYEEGEWTPNLRGSTTAGTATYSYQEGQYTKIGNTVFLRMIIAATITGAAGNMEISGIPFTPQYDAIGSFQANTMGSWDTNVGMYTTYLGSGRAYLEFRGTRTNNTAHHTLGIDNVSYLRVYMQYQTSA